MKLIVQTLFLTTIILAMHLSAFADETPQCTVESITNNCKFFSENKNLKIPMPDGTSIFNLFAYKKQEDSKKEVSPDRDQALNIQIQVQQIMDSIPDSRISARLKMVLISYPGALREGFLRDPVRGFELPWPPQSSVGNVKTVEAAELKANRDKIFTKDELDKLKAILKFQDVASNDQNKLNVLDTSSNVSQARLQKIQSLIEFVRGQIVDNILDGRKEETLSLEEKALLKKIRTIQYINPTDPVAANSPPCKSVVGNAFYNPLDHTFTVCPNIANYPDATLVQVMAHEFAHSIDPCYSQSGLYKIDHTKLSQASSYLNANKRSLDFIKNHNHAADMLQTLTALPPKVERINYDFSNQPAEPNPAKWLTDRGILIKEASGIPSSRYPFEKQFLCLLGEGKGFYRLTEVEMNQIADEAVSTRKKEYDKSYDPIKDRKNIMTALKVRPECSIDVASRQTQAQEVMADWMSGKALGAYLQKHPPVTTQDKVASIAFFGAIACYEATKIKERTESLDKKSFDAKIFAALHELRDRNSDPHPHNLQRLNDLLLTEPEVRKALGCSPLTNSCYNSDSSVGKKSSTQIQTVK